jgi:hypothetical protein
MSLFVRFSLLDHDSPPVSLIKTLLSLASCLGFLFAYKVRQPIRSFMPVGLSIITMPSESAFKKQAEIASDALKTFTAVQNSSSPTIVKAAVTELIDATIEFNNFVPFFVPHALFQEIPPAVFNVLENFSKKHPNFAMPSAIAKVAGLDARVKDSISIAKAKKGNPFSLPIARLLTFSCLQMLLPLLLLAPNVSVL